MADGVPITAGSGTTIATDDAGAAGHVQVVKLAVAADGSAVALPGDATDGLLVNLGANNDVTVAGVATAANQTTIIGHVDGIETVLGTIDADTSALAGAIAGTEMQVDVLTLIPGTGATSLGKAIDTAAGATDTGVAILAVRDDALSALTPIETDYVPLRTDANGALWVIPSGTVGVSGTVTVGSITAGDNNIGNVDIVTVPADPFGADADAASATGSISAKLRFIAATGIPITALPASTNTIEIVGDAAHDAAIAGNPVSVGGVSIDMDDTAPPNRASAEAEAVRMGTDRDGTIFAHPHGPQVWSYHSDGSAALTDASVHAAPGAGLSLYVTDIIVSTGAATAMNVFFEEGAAKVLGPYYLEAVAGRGIHIRFATPKKITANTALTVTTSAAIAQCVDVTGFTAPG